LQVALQSDLGIAGDASDGDVASYKKDVMNLLRSKYAKLRGFVIMDGRTHYEIDFNCPR
jgi:hypothetical protein